MHLCAVVLNNDDSCPNSLQNQQFVKYLFQAQPKGLVTLDFKQNGDYYISCAVSALLLPWVLRMLRMLPRCMTVATRQGIGYPFPVPLVTHGVVWSNMTGRWLSGTAYRGAVGPCSVQSVLAKPGLLTAHLLQRQHKEQLLAQT